MRSLTNRFSRGCLALALPAVLVAGASTSFAAPPSPLPPLAESPPVTPAASADPAPVAAIPPQVSDDSDPSAQLARCHATGLSHEKCCAKLEHHADLPACGAPAPTTTTPDDDRAASPGPPGERFLHGFRFGYGYVANYDKPLPSLGNRSLKDTVGMTTPSHFLLGYEAMYRLTGHSWLNVILVGNLMVAGLEQARFYPTANGLLGFELNDAFQIGVGPSFQPLAGSEEHVIVAAGWTPRVGSFYVPLHAFFIPDVDGAHRMGLTTGVTW